MTEAAARPGPFEFSGGALCLDFANTARYTPPAREDLPDFAALLTWAEQAGLMGKAQARAIRARAGRCPGEAAEVLARAKALRLAIYRVFAAIAAGNEVGAAELATIDRAAAEAATHYRIVPRDGAFVWEMAPDRTPSLARQLWPVARSAAELLTSGELTSVRECDLETCSWLFLDRSKNQKRRWCDMKVCGNRSKARRHYAKTRK